MMFIIGAVSSQLKTFQFLHQSSQASRVECDINLGIVTGESRRGADIISDVDKIVHRRSILPTVVGVGLLYE